MDISFYQQEGLNVETYDAFINESKQVEADLTFFQKIVDAQGGPVLELGSGTGRAAWALAKEGHQVVALDLSEAMVRVAKRKGAALEQKVQKRARFVRGDMSDFSLDEKFAVVLIPFRSFQSIVSPAKQRRSLECIFKHLKRKGLLVIDLFDPLLDLCLPGKQKGNSPEKVIHLETGNVVERKVTERINDTFLQTLTEKWVFTEYDSQGGVIRQETETLALRWSYRWEMKYLFELSGFAVQAEYSDFFESAPAYGKEQIWVVQKV